MTTIEQYFMQAELAQAAYGTFSIGAINTIALTDKKVGMTAAQAERFAETYTVVDQYTDSMTGVSATIFADKVILILWSSKREYMAIIPSRYGKIDYHQIAKLHKESIRRFILPRGSVKEWIHKRRR